MSAEADRLSRAGNYVLGLMNDTDRARAERDLEIDPAFRDAVFSIAERIFVLHQGALLAQGTPQEVQANEDVQRVYSNADFTDEAMESYEG